MNEKPVDPIDLDELERCLTRQLNHEDGFTCAKCRVDYALMDEGEPTKFCNSCAHELAEGALPKLIAEVRACRDPSRSYEAGWNDGHAARDAELRAEQEPLPAAGCASFEGDWSDMAGADMKTPLAKPSPAVGEALAALDVLCDVFPGLSSTAGEHTIRAALERVKP